MLCLDGPDRPPTVSGRVVSSASPGISERARRSESSPAPVVLSRLKLSDDGCGTPAPLVERTRATAARSRFRGCRVGCSFAVGDTFLTNTPVTSGKGLHDALPSRDREATPA